jgi:hypothetical protein
MWMDSLAIDQGECTAVKEREDRRRVFQKKNSQRRQEPRIKKLDQITHEVVVVEMMVKMNRVNPSNETKFFLIRFN